MRRQCLAVALRHQAGDWKRQSGPMLIQSHSWHKREARLAQLDLVAVQETLNGAPQGLDAFRRAVVSVLPVLVERKLHDS